MKPLPWFPFACLTAAALAGPLRRPASAAISSLAASNNPSQAGVLLPVDATTDPVWLSKARAEYPLARCPVCGDKVDGRSPEYIYRERGKPDRLVRFCEEDECPISFRKDPAKYLRIMDAAAEKHAPAKP